MIVAGDNIFETEEEVKDFKQYTKKIFEEDGIPELCPVLDGYFADCITGDRKLQKMVSEQISSDLISFLVLPVYETDDFNSFSFVLAAKDGRQVRKKEERKFKRLTHECFKDVIPYESRMVAFEEKNRNIYIE